MAGISTCESLASTKESIIDIYLDIDTISITSSKENLRDYFRNTKDKSNKTLSFFKANR